MVGGRIWMTVISLAFLSLVWGSSVGCSQGTLQAHISNETGYIGLRENWDRVVAKVYLDSPAYLSGIQPGDKIISVDGRKDGEIPGSAWTLVSVVTDRDGIISTHQILRLPHLLIREYDRRAFLESLGEGETVALNFPELNSQSELVELREVFVQLVSGDYYKVIKTGQIRRLMALSRDEKHPNRSDAVWFDVANPAVIYRTPSFRFAEETVGLGSVLQK